MGDPDTLSFLDRVTDVDDLTAETRRNIKLIIRIRYIVSPSVFAILALASLAGLGVQTSLSENQLIVNGVNLVVLLVLNVIYVGLSRRMTNLAPLVLFQLLIDVIHVTLTVYKTGGVASPFGFLYFFVIFEAAILIGGRATYLIAVLAAALYSLTTLLERLGWLPAQVFFSPYAGLTNSDPFLVLSWGFAVASYFGFAALAGHLTTLLARREYRLRQAYILITRRHETLMLLHRTSAALNTFETASEIADAILGELLAHLNLDRALLYRVADDRTLRLFLVRRRVTESRSANTAVSGVALPDSTDSGSADDAGGLSVTIPLEETAGLTARAAVRQEAYNVADPEQSEFLNRELARRIGMNPFALAPLVVRGATVGVIGIDRGARAIQNEEFRIFQVFANQAAITLFSLDPGGPSYRPSSSAPDQVPGE